MATEVNEDEMKNGVLSPNEASHDQSPSASTTPHGRNCRQSPSKEHDGDTSTNYSRKCVANSATADARDLHGSRRKFRIVGLRFPGKWINHEKLCGILAKCESFHVWFDKTEDDGTKSGGVSITFQTCEVAQAAFSAVHKMSIDGFKLQASKPFYESMAIATANAQRASLTVPFNVDASDENSALRLYAINLTSATDHTLLSSILGSDSIDKMQIVANPFNANEKHAEILFRSLDDAKDAQSELADGFEIDEGDRKTIMRLLSADEYMQLMKKENEKAVHHSRTTISTNDEIAVTSANTSACSSTAVVFTPAPTITIEDVASYLQEHIHDTRTNFAELHQADDLWKLCDEVSHQHKGIPDSMLKPALLMVFEKHLLSLPSNWMRRHVEELVLIWKKEVQSIKKVYRRTACIMAAAPYSPPRDDAFRKKDVMSSKKRRALTTMMCVGESLRKIRRTLAVEEGDLDIDEDEFGNFSIEGEPLSFDLWAKFSGATDKPVEPPLSSDEMVPFQPSRSERRKDLREKRLRMVEDNDVNEVDDNLISEANAGPIGNSQPDVEIDEGISERQHGPTKEELEDGEMESSASSIGAEKSFSSNSSSSDSDDSDVPSRNRRRNLKGHRRDRNVRSSVFNSMNNNSRLHALFKQLYERRKSLVKALLPSQKNKIIKVINQVNSSSHGFTSSAQQNMMKIFMESFAEHGLPGK